MKIQVHKYGGSSVATRPRIRHVAERVVEARRAGHAIAVVVSAMGDTTEALLDTARELSADPDHRELDMLLSAGERISTALLALAIQELGVDAISLTGEQSGIRTSDRHFNANVEDVNPARVLRELEAGKVVVAAGYQGVSPAGETTTLGRGGSDTSAVVLAAALGAEGCEIFSDVDGVYTADPRIVEDARPLEVIDYQEMLELARHGAGVLHTGAVEHARDLGVTLRAASTFSDAPGTTIADLGTEWAAEASVKGVACHRELVRMSMTACPELQDEVLEAGGSPEVYLGGTFEDDGRLDVLVRSESVPDDEALSETLSKEFGARVEVATGIGSVSAVGRGLGSAEAPRRSFARLGRQLGSAVCSHVAADDALTLLTASNRVEAATRVLHGALVEPAQMEEAAV